jgi:hypothetical protein
MGEDAPFRGKRKPEMNTMSDLVALHRPSAREALAGIRIIDAQVRLSSAKSQ